MLILHRFLNQIPRIAYRALKYRWNSIKRQLKRITAKKRMEFWRYTKWDSLFLLAFQIYGFVCFRLTTEKSLNLSHFFTRNVKLIKIEKIEISEKKMARTRNSKNCHWHYLLQINVTSNIDRGLQPPATIYKIESPQIWRHFNLCDFCDDNSYSLDFP